jgi:hypothetical protein
MSEKILVLEDDPGTASMLARRISTRGKLPIVAHTLNEAKQLLGQHEDLKNGVCDYNLGIGYSTEIIEEMVGHRGGRVVLLSATDDSSGGKARLEAQLKGKGLIIGQDKTDFQTVIETFGLPQNIITK